MQPHVRPAVQRERGFTLIELLIVVAIIGLLAAIALPGLLSARRSGNQASAAASLRTIDSAQRTFSTSCGFGSFATQLTTLGTPPIAGADSFISADLGIADTVFKSGYTITLAGGDDGSSPAQDACNGIPGGQLSTTFYATASPDTPGGTGVMYFWLGTAGTIYESTGVIAETNGLSTTPGGRPMQ